MTVRRPQCGTYRGHSTHKRRDERVCPDCSAAAAAYQQALGIESGRLRALRIDLDVLAALLDTGPGAEDVLRETLGARSVLAIRTRAARRAREDERRTA